MAEEKKEISKVELAREAREERLAEQNKDGGKAPLKLNDKRVSYITIPVLVIVLIAALLWGSVAFGLAQKYLPAAKVGDRTYTVAEYNYVYNSIANQMANYARNYGINIVLNEVSPFAQKKGQTWAEVIKDATDKQLNRFTVAYAEAQKKGITLDEKEQKDLDGMIEKYKENLTKGAGTFSEALIATYGKGVDEDLFRRMVQEQTIAEKYTRVTPRDIKYTVPELEKKYQAAKNDYDVFDFLYATLNVKVANVEKPKYPDTSKEKDKDKLKELNEKSAKLHKEYQAKVDAATKKAADEAAALQKEAEAAIKDPDTFKAFVEKHKDILQTEQAMKPVSPNHYNRIISMIADNDLVKFLSDSKRKANDKLISHKEKSATVNLAMYLNRFRDEAKTIHAAVRIVRKNEIMRQYTLTQKLKPETKITDEHVKAAYAAAEKVLENYLQDAKTPDKMKATEIKGYQSSYLDMVDFVPSTSPFATEVATWLESAERKSGDTKVFQDKLMGMYAVTFVKRLDTPAWQSTVSYKEADKQFQHDFEAMTAKAENEVKSAWAAGLADLAPSLPKYAPNKAADNQPAAKDEKQSTATKTDAAKK